MSCKLLFWVVFTLLFYTTGAFSGQCESLFSSPKRVSSTTLLAMAQQFDRAPYAEYSPEKAVLPTPNSEINNVLSRLANYRQRFREHLISPQAPIWIKDILYEYTKFFHQKSYQIEQLANKTLNSPFISLRDYTSLLVNIGYLGQNLERIIYVKQNPQKLTELTQITNTFENFERGVALTTALELKDHNRMVESKIEELLGMQKDIYEGSGYRVRGLLTTVVPNIKTINRLSAKGYGVLTIPKSVSKGDGLHFSIMDYLLHDQTHLRLSGTYAMIREDLQISNLSTRMQQIVTLQRNNIIQKSADFNKRVFAISDKLPPLESHLLEALYFYITHELGLPADKPSFQSFFERRPAMNITSTIYRALKDKKWGYDPVIENSKNLKLDILLSITNLKAAF